jgi:hypothetical protein
MHIRRAIAVFICVLASASAFAASPPDSKSAYAQILSQITAREDQFLTNIKSYSPLLETYIQNLKPDQELGTVPNGDQYFIGRLDMTKGVNDVAFTEDKGGWIHRIFGGFPGGSMKYAGAGFAMITPDTRGVDSSVYDYTYIRREFLGEVRCLVFDLSPKKKTGQGRFLGRIWVEDQNYNIVRFNGTYAPRPRFGYYFHFDSWRLNMGPNLWLPAYVYSEESDLKYGFPPHHLSFKAQTRLWGYNVRNGNRQDELTEVLVEPAQNVKDKSDSGHDLGPVQSVRQWHAQAEANVMERLERAGLAAPEGEVDRVLNTVVNNIEIPNKIELQPEIQCRVLLTAPLESFSVGHTIVLSRGLLDVIPDEATLAAVLAHEMGHILLTHGSSSESKYAFNDRMVFPDQEVFQKIRLGYPPNEEKAADAKGLELLKNSPYADKLGSAGLFLRALQQRAQVMPHLIRAHLGNGLALGNDLRMSELMSSAPELDVKKMDQIAALPMGARITVDPWNDKVELSKAKPVALLTPREKLMFEVTPVYPWVARTGPKPSSDRVATTEPGTQQPTTPAPAPTPSN